MKADITNLRETEKTYARRDKGFDSEIVAIDPKSGAPVVTARIYWPGSVAYCAIWINSHPHHGRGNGKAGGGGYHKASAALASAISDAGIQLSEPINGRGDSVMLEAVEAVARAVTGKPRARFIIHKAHA